jgi:hypothetical protein
MAIGSQSAEAIKLAVGSATALETSSAPRSAAATCWPACRAS